MADSPRKRYPQSPSWEENVRSRSRSKSRSRSRSRSRSWSGPRDRSRSRSRGRTEVVNTGNTLYVTGLSTRVTERDLEDHFSKEGKVKSVFLVVEPRSRISRGFAFITMDSVEDANRCVKHLNQSVLEGRYITVERSRRKRARTPTPGHYLGLKSTRGDGIVEVPAVIIMATGGLLGAHLTDVHVITLLDVHLTAADQEGTGPGRILLEGVLTGTMHVVLGWCIKEGLGDCTTPLE
ncbi:serine/arginine-rich splicing factor sr45a [Phtheirospermum japonicum]|uniref:Serine/arginine-rich splicing factor sr45a n=1 Tax=Phtheirospermum japonicum TaxID=374723 RepID=A0A830BUU8_9LAMI|nr:serine/arginine-rich splicing factor sr45a [Phtheirospermum japonicum]